MNTGEFIYYIPNFKIKFSDLTGNKRLLLDDAGIIARKKQQLIRLFDLDERELSDIGTDIYFYHPNPIAQGAIGYYDLWHERRSPYYLQQFWNQISWLEKNGYIHQGTLVYPISFKIPHFSNEKNWVSGMYQGQILSALVRAAFLSSDKKYMDMASKVYKSFKVPIHEKYGFMYRDKYGLWLEEAPKLPPRHILNGFIFASFGLYDYYKLTNFSDVFLMWNECIKTLENALPLYDSGFWSYYDANKKLASYNYHNKIHIPQLKAMYNITKIELFAKMARKWEKYSRSTYSSMRKKMHNLPGILNSYLNIRKNSK
jgi:hypothetical protein